MPPLSRGQAEGLVAAARDASNVETQREAADALRRAAFQDVNNKSLLMDAGAASVLATALRKWNDAEAKEHCACAVGWLAMGGTELQDALVDGGVLEPLVAFLPHLDEYGSSPAASALCFLTTENTEVAQQLRDVPGVMEALEGDDRGDWPKAVLKRLRLLSPSGRLVKPARGRGAGAAAAAAAAGGDGAAAEFVTKPVVEDAVEDEGAGVSATAADAPALGSCAAAAASGVAADDAETPAGLARCTQMEEVVDALRECIGDEDLEVRAAKVLRAAASELENREALMAAGLGPVLATLLKDGESCNACNLCAAAIVGLIGGDGDGGEDARVARQHAFADAGVMEGLVENIGFLDGAEQSRQWRC